MKRLLAVVGLLIVAVLSMLLLLGCPRQVSQPYAPPSGYVWTVGPIGNGPIFSGRYSQDSLTVSRRRGVPWLPLLKFRIRRDRDRLHSQLHHYLSPSYQGHDTVTVVIGFHERVQVSRIPIEWMRPGANSSNLKGGRRLVASQARQLARDREARYVGQVRVLERKFGAHVRARLLAAQAVVADVPGDRIRELARWNEVVSISPSRVLADPPQYTPLHSVSGVALEHSLTPFLEAGLMRGRIRLLDSGVDIAHMHLSRVNPRDVPESATGSALVLHDCINSPNCAGAAPQDCVEEGHGTASAAILVADPMCSFHTNQWGVTEARVHSYRVWEKEKSGGHVFTQYIPATILSAITDRSALPADVVAIQVCAAEDPEGAIGQAANEAFSKGAVVVAAIGNGGPRDSSYDGSGPQSPGVARGVLGIGARMAMWGFPDDSEQARGEVGSRQKPDLQFLTGALTAKRGATAAAPANDRVDGYLGTSGATPYAAAAALAILNLFREAEPAIEPGMVYAGLLACGEEVRGDDGKFPLARGAGLVRLAAKGDKWFGKLDMKGSGAKDPLSLELRDSNTRTIRAALWWMDPAPERVAGIEISQHFDFDLELLDPSGEVVAKSVGTSGVFERLTFPLPPVDGGSSNQGEPAPPLSGKWGLRITAKNIGSATASVYWAVFATP